MIPIPPFRLGIPSPSDKSNKLIVVMVLGSGVSNSWNNRDKLLKKFCGNGLNGGIEMDVETWSGHGGPRLSMEAR